MMGNYRLSKMRNRSSTAERVLSVSKPNRRINRSLLIDLTSSSAEVLSCISQHESIATSTIARAEIGRHFCKSRQTRLAHRSRRQGWPSAIFTRMEDLHADTFNRIISSKS